MLGQENQTEVKQQTNDTNMETNKKPSTLGSAITSTLNDHDYCSPHKSTKLQMPLGNNSKLETTIDQRKPALETETTVVKKESQSSNYLSECLASTSSSPVQKKDSKNKISPQKIPNKYFPDDDEMSDSSSSISSTASSKDLVIAQDPSRVGSKQLSQKDLAIVSKPKPGRKSSSVKKEFENEESHKSRIRKPRGTTSVTDKSQWITGEEQLDSALSEHLDDRRREKRQIKKPRNPDFSDYSVSSEEECADSGDDNDEDPNRPWCLCNRPDDGNMMLQCDTCEYWYHGSCVGVTEESDKKDWFCPECQDKLDSGMPRSAIPSKLQAEKKNRQTPKRRGRGRPKKSDVAREVVTRFSARNAKKLSAYADAKLGHKKPVASKRDARAESFEDFENCKKLKVLIQERKQAFFYKRSLEAQERAVKARQLGLNRQSITTSSLSDGLDSLATSTNTPNMSNLPINIKSEHQHKERSKPNIVLQINTRREGGSADTSQRIVTTIVNKSQKRKHIKSNDQAVEELFTAEPLKINKKSKVQADSADTVNQPASIQTSGDTNSPSTNTKETKTDSSSPSASEAQKKQRKKRNNSESSSANGSSTPIGSFAIIQKIKECLEQRSKQIEDIEIPSGKIDKLAEDIESQLDECFKGGSLKYRNKYRSLIFNLRDAKNQHLIKNVLIGKIEPSRLVRMSSDEMASSELSKWREMENKHSLDLIKRDAEMAAQQTIVKKTHKGEEVISAPLLNDPDDPTAIVSNQETPTTPTKSTSKSAKEAAKTSSGDSSKLSSGSLIVKISGLSNDTTQKGGKNQDLVAGHSNSIVDSLAFVDTTKDHTVKGHIFDINCKICTKVQPEVDEKSPKQVVADNKDTTVQEQPKRLRISIDTKLDPADISRLREPLIKPSEPAIETDAHSPGKMSSASESNSNEDIMEDAQLYDPETSVSVSSKPDESDSSKSAGPCWTGTIEMQDVAKFSVSASPVSGDLAAIRQICQDELSQTLTVCGRIKPDEVYSYIKKLKLTTKNQILLTQFQPLTDERSHFTSFFDYLYERNRCGVIKINERSKVLKDFYIIPISEARNIPDILKPINGPGLDHKEPNCMLGLLVKGNRPSSTNSSVCSYTPTPIK